MKSIIIGNLKQNKKTNLTLTVSITVSFILIFITSFIFSSAYDYIVKEIVKENGNYHVKIKTNLYGITNFSSIKKIKWEKEYVYITYNEIKKTYKETKKLCHQTKCENITYNKPYLSIKGVSKNKNMLKTFKTLITVVLIVILLSTLFIIYNVYKICIHQKYKQISTLKSIGMSKGQIIKMLIIENIIICTISIIISIILSTLIMLILSYILNNILIDLIKININLKFLLYAVIFILILVTLVALLPIFKINAPPVNLKKTEYKQSKINENNITALLAKANYKRSKNHYKPVIISLVISTILYSTFNILLNYTSKIIEEYVPMPKYDREVTFNNASDDNYKYLKNFGEKNALKYKIYKYCFIEEEYNQKKINVYLLEGNNMFVNKINETTLKNNKITKETKKLYKENITLNINNDQLNLKETNKVPYGFENMLTKDNLIVYTKNLNCQAKLTMFMKNKTNVKPKSDYSVDMKKGRELINNIILALKIVLYSIIILTLLVGTSSIITASFLSMEYRKKEFGILKSIGFNNFNDLITLESLYISLKSFIISFPIIYILNIFINTIFNNLVDIKFTYYYKPFIFSTLFGIILVKVIMSICFRKYKKMNIVDLIYSIRI